MGHRAYGAGTGRGLLAVRKKPELQTMSMEGMVLKMRPIAGIDIATGQAVILKPSGMHIRLVGWGSR
jgi:copper(I)-binding protein